MAVSTNVSTMTPASSAEHSAPRSVLRGHNGSRQGTTRSTDPARPSGEAQRHRAGDSGGLFEAAAAALRRRVERTTARNPVAARGRGGSGFMDARRLSGSSMSELLVAAARNRLARSRGEEARARHPVRTSPLPAAVRASERFVTTPSRTCRGRLPAGLTRRGSGPVSR